MTLDELIKARIRTEGPISIAEYMTTCLLHPTLGYYVTHDPFGQEGDFITAPEVSQMFGELVGLTLLQSWLDQGAPRAVTFAELGPGRGTLMKDALRAMQRAAPSFAPDIVLVEASASLRARQAETLQNYKPKWVDTVHDLPDQSTLLIANEFFDALPIRQFQRGTTGWHEVQVGLQQDKLFKGLAPETPHAALEHRLADTPQGAVIETCAPAQPILASVAGRIARYGGAGFAIDYGDWRSKGDTWQAVKAHQYVDPLDAPGEADLTAHVDFEALSAALDGIGAKPSAMTPQGIFLERLGITQRAQALAAKMSGDALTMHIAAHRRLTHPEEMGNLFKVMGIVPDSANLPPGLEAQEAHSR